MNQIETPPDAGATSAVADVRIRPAYPFDAERILRWRAEESAGRYQPLGEQSPEQLRAELGSTIEDLERGQERRFSWIVEAPRPAGWLTMSVHSWPHGVAEVGFSLCEQARGRGIMRRALPQLVDLLFSRTSLERIEARCDLRNAASIGLLEAVGFQREGVLRSYFVLEGERRDNALYSVLSHDWNIG